MPRLFSGIKIPKPIAQMLALKRGKLNGARWVDQEDYHITLCFIGDVSHQAAEEFEQRLHSIVHPPFEIELAGIDAFGSKKPRTLFAGVSACEALSNLHGKHRQVVQKMGLPAENRNYQPHVTLARLGAMRAGELVQFFQRSGGMAPLQFKADGFSLFSARESRGGGPYLEVEHYPFA